MWKQHERDTLGSFMERREKLGDKEIDERRRTRLSLRPKKTKASRCLSDCHKLGLDTQHLGLFRLDQMLIAAMR